MKLSLLILLLVLWLSASARAEMFCEREVFEDFQIGERAFPLTPALSLGERETVRQPSSNQTRPAAVRLCAILPLPAGEGRGEGESDNLSPTASSITEAATPRDTVVLLHGLAGVPLVMKRLEWSLRRAGYDVHSIGYPSTRHGIEELARDHVAPAISKIELPPGARLHFVTHSMGGLVLRQFLREQTPENLGRVVMLGPPNQGSEIADRFRPTAFYQFVLGPSGQQLGTGVNDFPQQLGPVNFPLGVIAGDCSLNPVFSRRLPGPDDGKVSVASTRVAGMSDFVVMRATHTTMVWRRHVIEQVRAFLATGKFQHEETVLN